MFDELDDVNENYDRIEEIREPVPKYEAPKGFTVISPCRVGLYQYADNKANRKLGRVGDWKFFSLSLNDYRNAHYRVLNDAKKVYFDVMERQLMAVDAHIQKLEKIHIDYQIIANNKRKFDNMNFASIIDKFFQDVLEKMGIIKDDNYKIVVSTNILPVVYSDKYTEKMCKIVVTAMADLEAVDVAEFDHGSGKIDVDYSVVDEKEKEQAHNRLI